MLLSLRASDLRARVIVSLFAQDTDGGRYVRAIGDHKVGKQNV